MKPIRPAIHCVLFDLDGTLLDTAPDLICCLQEALEEHGYPTIDVSAVKPFISLGALAMIEHGTGKLLSHIEQESVLHTMLLRYEQYIARHTVLFPGMDRVLAFIENKGMPWGIVTNKKQRFTLPLLHQLKLDQRVVCAVSGDSIAYQKPDPQPLWLACRQAGVSAEQCVYIGDAAHDILAGRRAGMQTLVATYGYLKPGDTPEYWHADGLLGSPLDLLNWLEQ